MFVYPINVYKTIYAAFPISKLLFKKGAFENITEDIEIIGFVNCGGCPGKKAVLRARKLVEKGADTIVFASCITRGNPIGYSCPFAKKMKEIIQKDLPENIRYIDFTH